MAFLSPGEIFGPTLLVMLLKVIILDVSDVKTERIDEGTEHRTFCHHLK